MMTTLLCHPYTTLTISCNKTAKKNIFKNWLQFLFFVKAAALKPQISEASSYIRDKPLTEINVMASFCFKAAAFTTKRNGRQFLFSLR